MVTKSKLAEWQTVKEHEASFRDDGNILYADCGSGFMVYTFKNNYWFTVSLV